MTTRQQFVIAAPNSNAGKTTVTLGLLRLFTRKGITVQPFKSGPDYLDPKFHQLACGKIGVNLDQFMMSENEIRASIDHYAGDSQVRCIEGVMGLFDGSNKAEHSTATLAKSLSTPVVLVVDAKAVAYSVAPLIAGFRDFDPDVTIVGVIFNKVGSPWHYTLLKEACEDTGVSCLGYLPKIPLAEIPSRHLGLNIDKLAEFDTPVDLIADAMDEHVDWKALLELSSISTIPSVIMEDPVSKGGIRFAVAKDEAFNFIYSQTIDAMNQLGTVTYFSPLMDSKLPPADFVYLPGGYPEHHANTLSNNVELRNDMLAFDGCIFAECGGLMYLGKQLTTKNGEVFPMVGHFDFSTSMENSKLHLGYRSVQLGKQALKGHEFHYSTISDNANIEKIGTVYNARGASANTDIYIKHNVVATYMHLYLGSEELLTGLIQEIKQRL